MDSAKFDSWPAGINNLAQPHRLPQGAVRDLVNLDPAEGGTLELRATFAQVLACAAGRAAFPVGRTVVVIDGGQILAYSTLTDEAHLLCTIVENGPIAGAELNGQLYLASLIESLRTDGFSVKPWAIEEPAFSVEVIAGGLAAGLYRVAVTATGADGEESSAHSASIRVPADGGLRITSADPRPLRVYASAANSETPYYQGLLHGGARALTRIDDSMEQLATDGLVAMPPCTEYAAYHGVIIGRYESAVFFSLPMWPHLMDPVSGFFQYGAPVTALAVTDGGVFVAADKTYFLTGLETDKPMQRVVLELGAVEGSAVTLPDGRAAWFTRYGQAIGSPDGTIALPNRQSFAPDIAAKGAAGVVEHNGNQMVVTTMRGITQANNLVAGDFADLET
jgi:hypothetical protein